MQVREGMTSVVLTVGPGHSLREAACRMAERKVGAAVVVDPDGQGPGIVTERDNWLACADPAQARASARRLVGIAEAAGATMLFGHDPAQWRELA